MSINQFAYKRNELLSEKIIKNLERRHMEGYYAKDKEEALKIALSLIPEGSSVGWGGSASIDEIGLKEAVKNGPYTAVDRDVTSDPEERYEIMRKCFMADAFIMGTNAISEDGQMVNIDGAGNRVAALAFGPKNVIVIAGMNKVAKTLDDAMVRARNVASPVNAQRFPGESVCRMTGACGDCTMEGCICSQIIITRNCRPTGRIKVILVNDDLGM